MEATAGEVRRRCRVLIIVENLPVPFDRRVWQEATTLKDAGYEVTVICPCGKGLEKRREILEGIRIYRHKLPLEANGFAGYLVEYSAALFWQMVLSLRVAFTHGFDVIHACNPPDTIFLVAALFKPFGKKFVFDHHDLNPELLEIKFGPRPLLRRILLLLERLTFRLADVSIATNESYRDVAISRGNMDPESVFVVRSAPDLDRLQGGVPQQSLRRGRRLAVGYVGIMAQQDGVDLLLHAAHEIIVNRGRTDTQFLLVGDGPELPALKRLADELSITDQVSFLGYLRGQPLLNAFRTMDVGVAPDLVNDYNDKCTMNKVLEYMAFGIPLVQFDLVEGRRSAGEGALYAQRNDPRDLAFTIERLLDDPELRKTVGRTGRRRIEETLAWHHEAPRLLAAYDKLTPIERAA
jgi:glycosyltransferase involved in cell wall biosynthesis